MTRPIPPATDDAGWLRGVISTLRSEYADDTWLLNLSDRLEALSPPGPDVVERVARLCEHFLASGAVGTFEDRLTYSLERCGLTLAPATAALDASAIGRDDANIECNEAAHLRRILRVARPYISDKAGAGIVGAIDAALKEQAP